MPIEIPYTFIAGTKAKAKEVNDNFSALATFVDQLEVTSAEIETLVSQIADTKANKNGQADERFQVADPSGDYDAVNRRTLMELTRNSRDAITGFIVSKQGNTAVNCTPGACWDSTYTEMMISNTSLTKDQSNLGSNATYYVYVTSDKETKQCELVISLSNATPELPTGFEYFRRLATITTDSNGYIDTIQNNSQPSFKNVISFPDYSKASGRSLGTTYTATTDGWVSINVGVNPDANATYNATFSVNGVTLLNNTTWKYQDVVYGLFPISKGDKYILSGNKVVALVYNFFPCKSIGG